MKANSNTLTDNTINLTKACGISLSGSDGNKLPRNELTDSIQEIYMPSSNNNLLGENTLTENHEAFYQSMCTGNKLLNNRICGNEHNFRVFYSQGF